MLRAMASRLVLMHSLKKEKTMASLIFLPWFKEFFKNTMFIAF
jgi:hypothetical protein